MKRPNGTATPKEIRIEEALERQTEREKLTPDQQLEVLDARLGKDTGAVQERIRLMKQKTRTKGDKNVKNSKTKRRQPDYEY